MAEGGTRISKRTKKEIERYGIDNKVKTMSTNTVDPDKTIMPNQLTLDDHPEIPKSRGSASIRTSITVNSKTSQRSIQVQKDQVALDTLKQINQLDEEEEDIERRYQLQQMEIKTSMDHIEVKKKKLAKIMDKDDAIAINLTKEIDMRENELTGAEIELQKFQIDKEYRIKSIQRKRRTLQQEAKLNQDKIDLLEEDETSSQNLSDGDLFEDDLDEPKEPRSNQTPAGDLAVIENSEKEKVNKLSLATFPPRHGQFNWDHMKGNLEKALQNEKDNAKKKAALEKASKAEAHIAYMKAEQMKRRREFDDSQKVITEEILRLQKDAQETNAVSASRVVTTPVPVLAPPANQTEAMMFKFFEMQMSLQQGAAPLRQNTSTFLARQSHAKDLPFFGGKPEEWPTFIAEFERSSTDCAFSNSENMSRLRKCLKGEAWKTVQCLMVSPDNLSKVLQMLKDRFGQPEHIIEAMICKAKTVPTIKEDKLETFIEFGNAIQNVTSSIIALKCDEHLNNPQLLREFEGKLPVPLRMNWMRWMESVPTRKKNLSFFSAWLESETVIACRLCPPKIESEDRKRGDSNFRGRKSGDTVHATSEKDDNTVTSNRRNSQNSKKNFKPRDPKCANCTGIGHRISDCKEFDKINANDRWKIVREKKLCFICLNFGHDSRECRKSKACGINNCPKLHHRLLHPQQDDGTVNAAEDINAQGSSHAHPDGCVNHANEGDDNLDTKINVQILPVRLEGPAGIINTFAMLDQGANITLIQADLADELGLKGPKKPLRFQGLHPIAEELESRCVKLNIMPATGNSKFGMINVRTIKKMPLPIQSIRRKTIAKWSHLNGLGIQAYEGAQPKLLIGSDHLPIMVTREVREGPKNAPVAARTNLGWTLYNPSNVPDKQHHAFVCYEKDDLHQLVKQYFTTESFGVKVCKELPRSKEDKRAQLLMDVTMKRVETDPKRWETGLLWKEDNIQLPESKSMALNRLRSIERKIDKEPKFGNQYLEKMQHYITKGYASKLTKEQGDHQGPRTWYLPHFATSKPSKPDKIRLVFDAAAKSNGICLNDALLKGSDQVNPLPSVLYKFRQKAVGITGDIREMFHQVNIREEDRNSLRFLWRGSDRTRDPDVYEMNVMVFGAACSPACAQEAKNRNAKEHSDRFPVAANAIIKKHFVDDYLDSFDTAEEAYRTIKEVIDVHLLGGFEIVNFISSSRTVMNKLPDDLKAAEPKMIDPDSSKMERVLGLNWDPVSDKFTFATNFHRVPKEVVSGERVPTKREALSLIMSIYDPLGFLANFTIKGKIQLQETWRSEVDWDEELPTCTHEKWIKWIEELQRIPTFQLSRCYDPEFSTSKSVQMHIFCDASQQAFAAVAYFRIETSKGVKVAFVAAKARVAPLKALCMPRMELQAAVLGVRLAKSIKEQHEIQPTETHYWTDSEVVYCWVRSDGNKCPPFVAHRIGEVQEETDVREWHWIPTKENVADEATRDKGPAQWQANSRWLNGPDFLTKEEKYWPKKSTVEILEKVNVSKLEFKTSFVGFSTELQEWKFMEKYSSWLTLWRVTGWITRALSNWRKLKSDRYFSPVLTIAELKTAKQALWKLAQIESFPEEVKALTNGTGLPNHSRIKSLDPYLDFYGVMRVQGRLDEAADVPEDVKKPVILDSKHHLTELIIQHYHELAGHQGHEKIVNELRQMFYILNVRTAVKKGFKHCQRCKNERAVPQVPQMGLMPECRLQSHVTPFAITGMDYFGPIEVTVGRRHEKRYGALFTCMSTRAVHIEIASSLTTESCLNAIRRFAARRGKPQKIYSDNGTNFHGADNELKNSLKDLDQHKIEERLTSQEIEWHFIPPAAPNMGGSWERLVRSIKNALKATLRERYPKEEVLLTLMAKAEHIVNSRPLTHVPYDPNDPEALTPNHFLIGRSSNMQPPGMFDEKEICLRSQWRSAQALVNMFWRRWVTEYLPSLTKRTKWHKQVNPVCVGDVVLIADNNMTRNCWPRGIVTEVFPGRDGQVRVAEVKTATGSVYKRPVSKLCILEVRKLDDKDL